VSRRERKKSICTSQRSGGGERETHAHRRGAGLSFAIAHTFEQMTAHGYQPRTATPAGGQYAMQWRTEPREANTHTRMLSQHCQQVDTHITASKRRVRGAGERRRALSPMVSRGVERSIKRRVERVERRSVLSDSDVRWAKVTAIQCNARCEAPPEAKKF
jgi:hypothetical protein